MYSFVFIDLGPWCSRSALLVVFPHASFIDLGPWCSRSISFMVFPHASLLDLGLWCSRSALLVVLPHVSFIDIHPDVLDQFCWWYSHIPILPLLPLFLPAVSMFSNSFLIYNENNVCLSLIVVYDVQLSSAFTRQSLLVTLAVQGFPHICLRNHISTASKLFLIKPKTFSCMS